MRKTSFITIYDGVAGEGESRIMAVDTTSIIQSELHKYSNNVTFEVGLFPGKSSVNPASTFWED